MELNEIISSMSLLLVFVTLLFNYFVPRADSFINFEISSISTSQEKLKEHKRKLTSFLIFSWLFPVVLLSAICSWIMAPSAINVMKTYDFSLLKFDIIPTIYVLVSIYIGIFSLLAIWKAIQLNKSRLEVKSKIN
jgi:hypothetical protein